MDSSYLRLPGKYSSDVCRLDSNYSDGFAEEFHLSSIEIYLEPNLIGFRPRQ